MYTFNSNNNNNNNSNNNNNNNNRASLNYCILAWLYFLNDRENIIVALFRFLVLFILRLT